MTIAAPEPLAPGRHTVAFLFEISGPPRFAQGKGAPGVGRLRVDGNEVAAALIESTAPVMLNFSGMFTCGYHHLEPFGIGYAPPFRFGGTIRRVGVVVSSTQPVDPALERVVFLKRQ